MGFSGRLGGNFYDNGHNNLNGRLSLYIEPTKILTAAVNYEHIDIIDTELPFRNAIYNYVVTIGAVGRTIRTDDYSVYLLYTPRPKVSLAGKILYRDYSDGNRKLSSTLEAGYQFMRVPYLRAGYNYFYLDYKYPAPVYIEKTKSVSAYYDPINFETHTLKLELRHDIDKKISYGTEGAISYIPKSDSFSYSLFLFGAYEFDEYHTLRLDARWFYQNKGVDRTGTSGHFWADNIILSYEYRF